MTLMKILGIPSYTPAEQEQEDYMSEKQKDHFKNVLKTWKEHLSETSSTHALNQEIQAFSDLNDRASYEAELSNAMRTQSRDRRLISRIEQSMRVLDSGGYGFCEMCDAEIGIHRLEARPVAQLCIDCKSLTEEKENI